MLFQNDKGSSWIYNVVVLIVRRAALVEYDRHALFICLADVATVRAAGALLRPRLRWCGRDQESNRSQDSSDAAPTTHNCVH